MRILRNHLIIAFGLIQPEVFIEYIRKENDRRSGKSVGKGERHFIDCIPDSFIYNHYALEYLHGNTYEEIENLHADMEKAIESRGESLGKNKSIFNLLPEYTLHVLSMDPENPLCRQNQKLNWRSCYLQLGQDILTAAHAAYISVSQGRRVSFLGWSAIIGTDDRRLLEILDKGIAENHFHLNGSVRGFELSWLCLMNHPRQIVDFFKDNPKDKYTGFAQNLNSGISFGTADNRLSWKRRILIACWLRVRLFNWLRDGKFDCAGGGAYESLLKLVDKSEYACGIITNMVSAAKYLYGRKSRIKQTNGYMRCLDYALTPDIACDESCCRSLAGERAFLYNAFYAVYSGRINEKDMKYFKELFYLYLLIKSQLRREIIQVNGIYGFKNFAKYQDRKDIIFEKYPKYALEAYNLSVRDVTENCYVTSLEMRIGPRNNADLQRNKIASVDDSISFLRNKGKKIKSGKPCERMELGFEDNCFYTLHFPKFPEKKKEELPKHKNETQSFLNHCRNYGQRKNTRRQALAVAKSFEKYNWLVSRIRGIDACTFEIPCRPEVFACEFRFLRNYVCSNTAVPKRKYKEFVQPKISATYHVGEDFMDIIDGLRAIDEALIFLEMKPYERLGHAIALGTDVRQYYKLKNHWLVLKKQDILDNIVWALNKTKALNINLGSAFKQKLNDKAVTLINEIYRNGNYTVCDYFNSWKLRGDSPDFYRFGCLNEAMCKSILNAAANNITAQYKRSKISDYFHPKTLKPIRKNGKAAELYSRYHFDYSVREQGDKCEELHITEDYIEMARALQEGMRNELAEKGIAIECNPSSNVLIGPFELYDQHPIFTFFPIDRKDSKVCQFVSINTDDQGVFDTSLAEEYALLECALRKQKNPDGTPVYSDVEIYDYMERLRCNGISQTFPKAGGKK